MGGTGVPDDLRSWGKARPADPISRSHNPIAYHSLDVAAVVQALEPRTSATTEDAPGGDAPACAPVPELVHPAAARATACASRIGRTSLTISLNAEGRSTEARPARAFSRPANVAGARVSASRTRPHRRFRSMTPSVGEVEGRPARDPLSVPHGMLAVRRRQTGCTDRAVLGV